MQDDRNCSRGIYGEAHRGLPWDDALISTNESSTPNMMLQTQTPALHELDGQLEELKVAHREIKTLQEQRRELERIVKELTSKTLTDDLTGLRNRQRFREDLACAWTYAVRHNLLLSAIVLDVDDFDSYTDTFGASAGDQLLRNLAGFLASGLRAYDVLAYLGGGQFALLLPSTDRTDARRIAERLRRGIEEHARH